MPGTKTKGLLWAVLLLLIVGSVVGAQPSTEFLAHWYGQRLQQHKLLPLLSKHVPELDTQGAYAIQQQLVQSWSHTDRLITGYKAGLTSKMAQQQFNAAQPISGVLFQEGWLTQPATVRLSDYRALALETELGFVLRHDITEPIADLHELRAYIASVHPVVELPDVGFEKMDQVKAVDLIAANVGSAHFIVLYQSSIPLHRVNLVQVSLSRNEAEIYTGVATDTMGDQWEALRWLINWQLEQGYALKRGHLLMTGAMGNLTLAEPGKYVADFGDYGKIEFTIKGESVEVSPSETQQSGETTQAAEPAPQSAAP